MRRLTIGGDKTLMVEKMEEALQDVKAGNPGYVTCKFGDPPGEVEFYPGDPSEDPDGDWSELQAEYKELPDE